MKLMTGVFDLWVFCRAGPQPTYLLLRSSQEKADRWFGGGRFWQILNGVAEQDEQPTDFLAKPLAELGLAPQSLWAVEHVYMIFNRRYNALQILPVFAAEVAAPIDVPLGWEQSESRWATAAEAAELLTFRGLHESLHWLREHITEGAARPEFRLS